MNAVYRLRLTLSFSSLRRIAHSTSLRATGSLIVCCRSLACAALPLRAAVMASLRAARSAGDAASLEARAGRAGRFAVGAAAFDLAVLAGASTGRGFGKGTPAAESAARATTRVPAASRTVKDRGDARMVKSRPVRPPSDIYSLDKIDEGLTGGPLPLTAAKRRRRRIPGAFFAGAFPVTMAAERGRGAPAASPERFQRMVS